MWIRTFIMLTLGISAFGYVARNEYGESIRGTVGREMSGGRQLDACETMSGDIVFIIDGSRSIHRPDFKKQIAFLESFVGNFTIGRDHMRFGAVTFGDKIILDNTFPLSKYTNKDQLKQGISEIDFRYDDSKWTQTHEAIKYAREILFKDARPYARKLAIVITDGKSREPTETEKEAMKMREAGIVILAIGVGKDASEEELETITGREDYVFMVDKYSMLKTIKTELRKRTCQHEDEGCNGNVDINFVFDSSMLSYQDTRKIINFITTSIADENFDEKNLRFGTVSGERQKVKGFRLDAYQSKTEVKEHFDSFHQTSIAPLLGENLKQYFTAEYGGRSGARKVAVIFLKGKMLKPDIVENNVKNLNKKGIDVFGIKMDDMNSPWRLEKIFGRRNILDAQSETSMEQLSSEFVNRLCKL